MSSLTDWGSNARGTEVRATRSRALLTALGLTIGGTLVSFIAFLVLRPTVTNLLDPTFPAVSALATSKLAQIGFAVFLIIYFAITHRWEEFVQVHRSHLHDLIWVVLGAAALDLFTAAVRLLLPLLGLSIDLLSTGGLDVGLATWPLWWPIVFLGLYYIPALVEEQFYRGLLQGHLKKGFHPVSEIILGAGLYSLSHALYGIGRGPDFLAAYLIYLFGIGLAFCLTYERTNNLLVVGFVHAQSWTAIDFPFFGLL